MGIMVGLRVWWFLFFAMAIASATARNTISLSAGKAEVAVVAMEVAQVHQGGGYNGGGGGGRRSLVVSLNDYNDPTANHGHDPKNKGGSNNGGSGHGKP